MGNDPESTLDLSLGVKGCRNLYVLSTGALPSAGTANPTFTMLCLGEQLSDHLTGLAPRFSATPEGEPAGSARC
jgi:choline dehydrogenase-like flavoprotein